MGIYDRDYLREQLDNFRGQNLRTWMPRITPAVKWLLIANVIVFLVQTFLLGGSDTRISSAEEWLAVYPSDIWKVLQVWRLITYQFLHGGFGHIFGNMLGLFFFGPLLEGLWGSRRFLIFYLICGMLGGILYPLLVLIKVLLPLPLIGASGAVLGIIAAAAVLFPRVQVFVMGIFPLPLVVLAIIIAAWNILDFMTGANAGGAAVHLAGMAGGAGYVLYKPWLQKTMLRVRKDTWSQKLEKQRKFEQEVDRILEKVHTAGIAGLSGREKKILKEATRREQAGRGVQ